jgi:hypothetical protein
MFVFRTEDVVAVEACVKGTLIKKKYRSFREVFKVDIDVLKQIVTGCSNLQGILKLEHRVQKPGKLTGGCYMCAVRDP